MVKTTSPTNMTLMTMYEHLKTCNLCSITKLYIFTQVQEFFNVIGVVDCSHCVQGSNILTCTELNSIFFSLRMIIKQEFTECDWEYYARLYVFLSYCLSHNTLSSSMNISRMLFGLEGVKIFYESMLLYAGPETVKISTRAWAQVTCLLDSAFVSPSDWFSTHFDPSSQPGSSMYPLFRTQIPCSPARGFPFSSHLARLESAVCSRTKCQDWM